MTNHEAPGTPGPTSSRTRRRRRKVLIGVGVALVLLVALAPTIAGWFAPGIIASSLKDSIPGRLSIGSASFGWFGGQGVGPVTISDPDGKQVARVEVHVSKGLLGLLGTAAGSANVGEVRISGSLDIVRAKDGTTNLGRALGLGKSPAAPGPSTTGSPAPRPPAHLPKNLNASLNVTSLAVTFTDQVPSPARKVALTDITLVASVNAAAADARFSARASQDGVGAGTITGSLKATVLAGPDGTLTPQATLLDADISLAGVPTAVIDTLAGRALAGVLSPGATLADALGPALDTRVTAKGNTRQLNASLEVVLANLHADGSVRYADRLLTLDKPLGVSIRGSAVRALAPGLDAALKGQQDVTLAAFPDASLRVESLSLPIDLAAPSTPDLRPLATAVQIDVGAASGTVRIDPSAATPSAFATEPLTLRLASARLGDALTIQGSTRATIDAKPAGDVVIDLAAADLLDSSGKPSAALPTLRGKVEVRGVATALAQPFAQGIDLRSGIGPALDLSINAQSQPAPAGAPALRLDLSAHAEKLGVTGSLVASPQRITTLGQGLRLDLANAGAIVGPLIPRGAGMTIAPTGSVVVYVPTLDMPLTAGSAPDLAHTRLGTRTEIRSWRIVPDPATGAAPIDLAGAALDFGFLPGGDPRLVLDAILTQGGVTCHPQATFDFFNTWDAAGRMSDPSVIRPVGTLDIADLPTALADVFLATPARGTLDVRAILAQALGNKASIKLVTSRPERGDSIDLALSISTPTTNLSARAGVSVNALELRSMAGQLGLTPAAFSAILAQAAPQGLPIGTPRLTQDFRPSFALDAMTIPIDRSFKPDLAATSPATLRLDLSGLALDGLSLKDDAGNAQPLGAVGLGDGSVIAARVAIASLLAGPASPDKDARVDLDLRPQGPSRQSLGAVKGTITAPLAAAQPAGPIVATLALQDLAPAVAEAMLPASLMERGTLPALAGQSVAINLKSTITPPAPVNGQVDWPASRISAEVAIAGERVSTPAPLALDLLPDRIALSRAGSLSLTPDPAFLNARLAGAKDAKGSPAAGTLQLIEPVTLTASIKTLALSRGAGPLKPGVFALDVDISVPHARFMREQGEPLEISALAIHATHPANSTDGAIHADLKGDLATGPEHAPLELTVAISRLASPEGVPTPDLAIMTASGDLHAVPTPLIDALARQHGLLVEVLGPTLDAKVRAEGVSLKGSEANQSPIDLELTSPRAKAHITGVVREGTFVATRDVEAQLLEITPALGGQLNAALPIIGTLEKKPTDRPAMVRISDLSMPISGGLSALSAKVQVDPGEARFATSTAFGELLNLVKVSTQGLVGQRLDPLSLTIDKGVIVVPPYNLKLGEFTLQTQGQVNLGTRGVDIVTRIPFGALSDEIAGKVKLNSGLGAAVGRVLPIENLTMIPFRTSGTFDKSKTSFDAELLVKDLGKSISPERVIDQLPELIPGLKKKKDEKPK